MTAIDRIVIVGASLAGLRTAEALRHQGFTGVLTIIGDEPHHPYDRPPLSKQALLGTTASDRTGLPRLRETDATWRLGLAARGLDLPDRCVILADGSRQAFDRLLVATGTRARPWIEAGQARLSGVMTLRTRADAAALASALDAAPRRIVVIGGGFTGSEIASVCRSRGLAVTLVEHNMAPLASALGTTVGAAAASLQRAHGVDLRCSMTVARIEDDGKGGVAGVVMSDGTAIAADLVVVALGSLANVEWLAGSGLAFGPRGLACDAGCRALDAFGIASDDVFVAGDVARFPHPLFNFEFMTLERWGNAVAMARVAAHNMLHPTGRPRPHVAVPGFWSSQFDISIKLVGVPPAADHVMVVQGSFESGAFLAAYGRQGRLVAAVGFDHGKWLPAYERMIAEGGPFPPEIGMDAPLDAAPMPAGFPSPSERGLDAYITLSGHVPGETKPGAPTPTLHRTAPGASASSPPRGAEARP